MQIDPHSFNLPADSPIIVCFGAGVDSTALLVALKWAGIRPDLITFADTGGEKPETYEHARIMDSYLADWGFPVVTWCKKRTTDRVNYSDLEGNCIENETMPSLAFGHKSCSIKWKQTPQDGVVKGVKSGPNKCPPHPLWLDAQSRGVKPVKLIGYDCGRADIRRSKNLSNEDDDFYYSYPLQSLRWQRQDCIRAILEAGLPVPIKSACFYCPASKFWELFWLAGTHPDLFMKALDMEYKAMVGRHSRFRESEYDCSWEDFIQHDDQLYKSKKAVIGLGRAFSWNQWARSNDIINEHGEYIADKTKCLAKADELRAVDNALDMRSEESEIVFQHELFNSIQAA